MTNCNLSRIAMTEEGKDELKATNMGNNVIKSSPKNLLAVCWPSISQQIFRGAKHEKKLADFFAPLD